MIAITAERFHSAVVNDGSMHARRAPRYEWEAANHQLRAVVTERSRVPPGRTLRVLPIALLGSYLAPLARQFSQRFAHSSTRWNAGGLICRVRDGYGSRPAAVAALMPIRGVEPRKAGDRWADAFGLR